MPPGAAAIVPRLQRLPVAGFAWLLAGGILYTVGGVLYAVKLLRPKIRKEIRCHPLHPSREALPSSSTVPTRASTAPSPWVMADQGRRRL